MPLLGHALTESRTTVAGDGQQSGSHAHRCDRGCRGTDRHTGGGDAGDTGECGTNAIKALRAEIESHTEV